MQRGLKEGGLSVHLPWLHSYAPPLPRRPGAAKLPLERSEHRRRVGIAGLELGRHAQQRHGLGPTAALRELGTQLAIGGGAQWRPQRRSLGREVAQRAARPFRSEPEVERERSARKRANTQKQQRRRRE